MSGGKGGGGMSTHILSACWALSGMSSTQKLVLISLADQANKDGIMQNQKTLPFLHSESRLWHTRCGLSGRCFRCCGC